jgi:hypothetical protein
VEDIHLKMMDKFLEKLFEKKSPLTDEEIDELEEEEKQGVLMVWERIGAFNKMIICQVGKRKTLIKIAQILEQNGYEAEVQ